MCEGGVDSLLEGLQEDGGGCRLVVVAVVSWASIGGRRGKDAVSDGKMELEMGRAGARARAGREPKQLTEYSRTERRLLFSEGGFATQRGQGGPSKSVCWS